MTSKLVITLVTTYYAGPVKGCEEACTWQRELVCPSVEVSHSEHVS